MATLYSAYTIKNTLTLLSTYANSITEKSDYQKVRNRALTDLRYISTMLHELAYSLKDTNYVPMTKRELLAMETTTLSSLRDIQETQEGETLDIKGHLLGLIALFAEDDMIQRFDNYSDYEAISWMRYLMNNVIDDDREELSTHDAETIMNQININRPYNVFSPRCGKGYSLSYLSGFGECTTYGLEQRESIYPLAKTRVDRMIKGEMHGSKISNDVFDIMHIPTRVSWEVEYGTTGNLLEKKEKATLRNSIKYLRKNGILIYTLPVTRLTKDMAFIFAKLLKDVQVLKAEGDFHLPYVHVIGKKDISKEAREDVYAYLRGIRYNNIPTELTIRYDLASGGIYTPDLYRGSVLDEDELDELVSASGLMDSFWKQQEVSKDEDSMRPLLPFNMGQIGLVLTSGCLDGVVEEYEGQYHAIKGMVTKIRDVKNSSTGSNNETSIETISNKVQINILTPNGDFIELA